MGQRGRPSLEVGRRVNGAKCCCTETLGAFYSRYIRDSLLTKSKMAGQETFHVNLTPSKGCCCPGILGATWVPKPCKSEIKQRSFDGEDQEMERKEALSLSTGAEKTTFQKSEVGYISGL